MAYTHAQQRQERQYETYPNGKRRIKEVYEPLLPFPLPQTDQDFLIKHGKLALDASAKGNVEEYSHLRNFLDGYEAGLRERLNAGYRKLVVQLHSNGSIKAD